jgi:hypothetical protein
MKMEQIQCSETLAFKLQTSGNNPDESMTFKTRRKFEIKKYFFFAELILTTNIFLSMLNITGYAKSKLYFFMHKLSMNDYMSIL